MAPINPKSSFFIKIDCFDVKKLTGVCMAGVTMDSFCILCKP